jgi:hypothetical protein
MITACINAVQQMHFTAMHFTIVMVCAVSMLFVLLHNDAGCIQRRCLRSLNQALLSYCNISFVATAGHANFDQSEPLP